MTDQQTEHPYPINPLAENAPQSRPARYKALVARISRYDARPPITVWRGQIIFGVELLKAYAEAGVDPTYEFLEDDTDLIEYFGKEGLPFLEMSTNERAILGHYMSESSTRGRPSNDDQYYANLRIKQKEAATLSGVSVRLISDASRVLSKDSKAVAMLQRAVQERMVNVSDAAKVVEKPPEVQEKAVDLVTRKEARTVRAAAELIERERAGAEEQTALAEMLAKPVDETVTLHVAQAADLLRTVPAVSIDAVITHPPHVEDQLFLFSDLAAFAAHVLKPTGFMAVVGGGMLLPEMLRHLEHAEIRWIMEQDLDMGGPPAGSGRPYFLRIHRRPLLIYGKPGFRPPAGLDDIIRVPAPDALPPGLDRNEVAMRMIMEKLCRPGQTVCDPCMLDRAGAALAARQLGCTFIGATEQQSCRDRIRKRLEEVGKPASADGHEDNPAPGTSQG